MNKRLVNIIIAIILGLALWYLTMKFMDAVDIKRISPLVLMFIPILYSLFLKPLLIFSAAWLFLKDAPKYINKLCAFYAFLHLIICIVTLIPTIFRPSFENIWQSFSLLFAYILFRFIAVLIGRKEMTVLAYPEKVASKYHFLAPFFKPKEYGSVVIEKGKPVTLLKGYFITLLLFFLVELSLSFVKFILRSLVG